MNEVIQNILTRRSIRSYKQEQISDADLETIIEAAKYAPSGSNSQSWNFTVIQNKEKLEELNLLIKKGFQNLVVDENTYPAKKAGKKAAENDNYNFYYHAPTLIIVSNLRGYGNAMADCSTALQNIFLTAHSLGIGSCWINQTTWLSNEPEIIEFLKELGIPENYVICGAAAIGYCSGIEPKALQRKEITVNIIK